MALIDVVNWYENPKDFIYKFPSDNLRIGTQLVVYAAQTAFFIKGGKICDEFTAGTYTISSENLPILNELVNLPFGKSSPFKAEVWFVNQIARLDIKWGTPQAIQLEDPKYHIIVPVRAFGQYGFRVSEPRKFMETVIGSMTSFTTDYIESYFKGKLTMYLSSLIASKIALKGVSVLDINTQLPELSESCQEQLNEFTAKYGISIVDFAIMSISVPEDDHSLEELKSAKNIAASLRVTGRDVYQMRRSFDVLERVAGNEGAGGQLAALGAGYGVGTSMGHSMEKMSGSLIDTNPVAPPPLPTYYVLVDGEALAGKTEIDICNMMKQGLVTPDTLIWRNGMADWTCLSEVPELSNLLKKIKTPPVQPKKH